MVTTNSLPIFVGIILTCASCSSAFFLNWGSPEPAPIKIQQGQQPWPVTTYYQQRILQPQQYSMNGESNSVPIPAIPIQVPLQAQLSPASNIQNVQLVPCLCPVSQDYEYDKGMDPGSVFLSQIKAQQPQH